MPPRYITNAAEFVQSVVFNATTEDIFLDFKSTIDKWKAPDHTPDDVRIKAQMELCRDVAQFANTRGGVLLIGVTEFLNAHGIKVATGLDPVTEPDLMREWIEQAVTNRCVPSTFDKEISFVAVAGGTVVAINVSPSLHAVYVWNQGPGTIEVIGRTNHGKKRLNPHEMERHIMNGSRAAQLSLEKAAETATSKAVVLVGGVTELAGTIRRDAIKGEIHLGPRSELSFELLIPCGDSILGIPRLSVPYELLRATWVDAAGRLNVLLESHVVWTMRQLQFENPFR